MQDSTKEKVIIWSKPQCSYCVQAKNLLKAKGIQYEERIIGEGWLKEQLLEAVLTLALCLKSSLQET